MYALGERQAYVACACACFMCMCMCVGREARVRAAVGARAGGREELGRIGDDDREVDEEGKEEGSGRLDPRVPEGLVNALLRGAVHAAREDQAGVKVQVVRHDDRAECADYLRAYPESEAPPSSMAVALGSVRDHVCWALGACACVSDACAWRMCAWVNEGAQAYACAPG